MKNSQKSNEEDFFDYALNEYRGEPSKNSAIEFLQQSKQIPMQAIGQLGSISKGLREASEKVGPMQEKEMPYLPGSEFAGGYAYVPNIPIPTSSEIGEKLGYEEPSTSAGRIGKGVFSNVGAALPLAAINPASAPGVLGYSALGGGVGQGVRELGGPDTLAEAADIGTSLSGIGKKVLQKAAKPSGLTQRWFEDAKKSSKMAPSDFESLKGKIEDESKSIADNIFSKNQTYEQIKNFPIEFQEDLDRDFDKVSELSKKLPIQISGSEINSELLDNIKKTKSKFASISTGESHKSYNSKTKELLKEIRGKGGFNFHDIVSQYRENNNELGNLFNVSESNASNEGKKLALLDYNRALSKIISKKAPNSEIDSLFKLTNKNYSDSMNINKVDSYIDSIFKGDKINYKEIIQYFKDKDIRRSVRMTFGDKAEKDFSQLVRDIQSQEKGMSKIKPSSAQKTSLGKPNTWINKFKSVLKTSPKLEIKTLKPVIPNISGKISQKINEEERKGPSIEEVLSR